MASTDKTDQTVTRDRNEALSGPQEPRTHLPRRETRNSTRSRASGPHSPQDEASTADAPAVDSKTARQKIADLLWWSVPSSTDEQAKARTEQLLDAHRTEVLTEVTTWLIKKAREFHASSRKRDREQGDTAAILASKIARGAVHPNNTRMLPNPGFFEPDHTYQREHHGDTIHFLVEYVSTSPDGRSRAAHGWRTRSWDPGWEPSDSDDFTGWTDVTEGASEVSRG